MHGSLVTSRENVHFCFYSTCMYSTTFPTQLRFRQEILIRTFLVHFQVTSSHLFILFLVNVISFLKHNVFGSKHPLEKQIPENTARSKTPAYIVQIIQHAYKLQRLNWAWDRHSRGLEVKIPQDGFQIVRFHLNSLHAFMSG